VGSFIWATLPCVAAGVVVVADGGTPGEKPTSLLLVMTASLGAAYALLALTTATTCLVLTISDPTSPSAACVARGRVSPGDGSECKDEESGPAPQPQPPPLPPGWVVCHLCPHAPAVPSTARHCMTCGRCVDGFDHHCPWVGNDVCVGGGGKGVRGRALFLALLGSGLAQAALQAACAGLALWHGFAGSEVRRKPGAAALPQPIPPWWVGWTAGAGAGTPPGAGPCGAPSRLAVTAAGGAGAVAAGAALGALLAYHALLAVTGQTTYERVVAGRAKKQRRKGGGGQVAPEEGGG